MVLEFPEVRLLMGVPIYRFILDIFWVRIRDQRPQKPRSKQKATSLRAFFDKFSVRNWGLKIWCTSRCISAKRNALFSVQENWNAEQFFRSVEEANAKNPKSTRPIGRFGHFKAIFRQIFLYDALLIIIISYLGLSEDFFDLGFGFSESKNPWHVQKSSEFGHFAIMRNS